MLKKAKNFGRNLLKQQITGKVIDITFKGDNLTLLTIYGDDFPEITSKIKALL